MRELFVKVMCAAIPVILLFIPVPANVDTVHLMVSIDVQGSELKRSIDFFEAGSDIEHPDFRELHPRHITFYSLGHRRRWGQVRKCIEQGYIPVCNFMGVRSLDRVQMAVDTLKSIGVKYYQLWSEPNRTWGEKIGDEDNWLRTITWQNFLEYAGEIYERAVTADSNAVFCGPVLTADHKNDPHWYRHLVEFVNYWAAQGNRLDYLTFNPPWDPEQVRAVSDFARGAASYYPQLQLKGIALGEYPFFIDAAATHIRFFVAIEDSWNLLYAAKSHFRESSSNSGLVLENGKKKPVYWVFHRYARMMGKRLKVSPDSLRAYPVIAVYDSSTRRIDIMAANDTKASAVLNLRFDRLRKNATATISQFTSDGPKRIRSQNIDKKSAFLSLGLVSAGDALLIEIRSD